MKMAFEVEKHSRIVIVIETIIAVLIGIGCLAGIITMIVLASATNGMDHPETSPPGPTQTNFSNSNNTCNETKIRVGPSSAVGPWVDVEFAVPFSFLLLSIFLVSLILLIILWKGVNNKESRKCNAWYISQSSYCGFYIFVFLIFFAAGFPFPIYVHLINLVYLCYRIYSIHVIRSYANMFPGSPNIVWLDFPIVFSASGFEV